MSTYLEGDETTGNGAHKQRETERVKAPEKPPSALRLQRVAARIKTQEKEKNDRSHGTTRLHEWLVSHRDHPTGETRRGDAHPMGRLM